jgi:hypothetical protein
MKLSESDTRAKLIDPALHRCGWTEDLVRREETDQGIDVVVKKPKKILYGIVTIQLTYIQRLYGNLTGYHTSCKI